ncbi:MAG: DUF4291 domain-containing protein [Caldilineaceae bacterium]|nr:DUF4291 domain-containing protein [Caldilineaceae bacterium]
MQLRLETYLEQVKQWPQIGQQIFAQFDDNTVVVYQAFSAEIAEFAVQHGYFGGNFRLNRMSWIKPNFLWMMYRSGWATKSGQEHVLAIRIGRSGFEEILRQAVHSNYVSAIHETEEHWREVVAGSDVRLQWDPDHDPHGKPLQRRAIQLGLRGQPLKKYAQEWIVSIEDITKFVHKQHQHVISNRLDQLQIPRERVYPILDADLQQRLNLSVD